MKLPDGFVDPRLPQHRREPEPVTPVTTGILLEFYGPHNFNQDLPGQQYQWWVDQLPRIGSGPPTAWLPVFSIKGRPFTTIEWPEGLDMRNPGTWSTRYLPVCNRLPLVATPGTVLSLYTKTDMMERVVIVKYVKPKQTSWITGVEFNEYYWERIYSNNIF